MTPAAIEAIGATGVGAADPATLRLAASATTANPAASGAGFGDIMMAGLRSVDAKLENADALVRQFALDDSVPIHQVTIALGEARLAVELATQVRTRLLEGYRELMNMQL